MPRQASRPAVSCRVAWRAGCVPESACAERASSASCRCRTAAGESALSESAPEASSAPFHRARSPPRRRGSTAPLSADVGCSRALEKGKCRRARAAPRAAGRLESGPTCCFIGTSQTAFPKTWSIPAIEGRDDSTSSLAGGGARAPAHTIARAGHALRSPLQPIRSPRVAPRAAASSAARAVALVVRNDGPAAVVVGGRRPFAGQPRAAPRWSARAAQTSAAARGKSARSRLLHLAGACLLL